MLYISFIYISSQGKSFQTNIKLAYATNVRARNSFSEYKKKLAIDVIESPFICNLIDPSGNSDVVESFGISKENYEYLTAKKFLGRAEYKDSDHAYHHGIRFPEENIIKYGV